MKKGLVAAMAVFAMMSCSKENSNNNVSTEGESTYARLEVVQPTSTVTKFTRGAATAYEKNVKNLSVYVFDKHKALEQIVDMNTAEIASGKNFKTTTGQHFFLVAANKPAAMPVITIAENMHAVEKKLYAVANSAALTTITTAGNGDGGSFFMTNIDGAASEELPGGGTSEAPAATITLKIGRAMAKVNTTISDEVAQPNGTLKNAAAGDVQYMVAGNPVKMHTFPVVVGGQLQSPLFTEAYSASNYFPAILPTDGYAEVSSYLSNMGVSTYAVENSNIEPQFGKSSYVIITGIYAPAKWYTKTGVLNPTVAVYGDTFFRIGKENASGKIASFTELVYSEGFNETELQAELERISIPIAERSSYKVVEYVNGRVYYGLWLANNAITGNPIKKYTVARNNFFKVVINEINGPGYNKPDFIPDPTDPIETETWIKAKITVEDWTVIDQGGIIG